MKARSPARQKFFSRQSRGRAWARLTGLMWLGLLVPLLQRYAREQWGEGQVQGRHGQLYKVKLIISSRLGIRRNSAISTHYLE